MRIQGYLRIMDLLGVMETRWFGIQGISGFDSFFLLSGATWAFCPGVSILLSSDLLSAYQLPQLTDSCCSFSFDLLRPSRPQTGRHCFLALGQLVAHQHLDSTHQAGLLGQDCLLFSVLTTSFSSILISILGAAWPKQLPASFVVPWGPGVCLAESTAFRTRWAWFKSWPATYC